MVKRYFSDRNYTLLYIHKFFFKMSSSIMYTITGAYFLHLGVALPLVILFFGLEFGLRAVLCPIGLAVFNKMKPVYAIALSNLSIIIFFSMITIVETHHGLMFIALFFYSLGSAIFYPLKMIMEAVYIKDDHNRGRQLSLTFVIESISAVISVALAAYFISHFSYLAVSIMVTISLFLSTIPFVWLKGEPTHLLDYRIQDGYKFLLDGKFKDLNKPLFGQQLRITMNIVFIPLFIYTVIDDIEIYGYITAAALLFEMIFTLFIGQKIDKQCTKHNYTYPLLMNGLNSLMLMTIVTTPLSAFFADSFNKISYTSFYASFTVNMQKMMRTRGKSKLVIFGCCWEMALCFGELITISSLAFIAYFIGNGVFYIAFALGTVGCYMALSFFKDKPVESREEYPSSVKGTK